VDGLRREREFDYMDRTLCCLLHVHMTVNSLYPDQKIEAFTFGIQIRVKFNLCYKVIKIQVHNASCQPPFFSLLDPLVISVAVTANGRPLFASGSGDNRARVWSY
jgi:hypothetical protein